MRALEQASRLLRRAVAAADQRLRPNRFPYAAAMLALPPDFAGCNICGFVPESGRPRLCPRCGTSQRQRSFKQLFWARLRKEVFAQALPETGLLLSPGPVERTLLFPQLRQYTVSSLYQTYTGIGPYVRADVRDLVPFQDEIFDYVQACNVLDYVPELDQALRAIHRVLRPGGLFVFLIPEQNLLRGNEPISVSTHATVTGRYWPDPTAVPFVRLGRQTLREMLLQTGFAFEEVRYVEPLSGARCTWWLCQRHP
jgi:hypothetical protein